MRCARLALLMVLGCGSAPSTGPISAQESSASLNRDYPALRFVPENASYVVTAGRLRDAAAALREVISVVGLIYDVGLRELNSELRRNGMGVLEDRDLHDAGLDLEGGVVVFSRGYFPTAVARVRDRSRLEATLLRLLPTESSSVRPVRGHDVYTLNDGVDAVGWVIFDDWFAVRFYDPRVDPEDGAWFGRLLDTSPKTGAREVAEAVANARRHLAWKPPPRDPLFAAPASGSHPGVVGVVHPSRVFASFPPEPRQEGMKCAGLVGGDRIVFAADMAHRSGRGVVVAELATPDADALAAIVPPPLSPGMRAFMDSAAVAIELAINPADATRALARRCSAVPTLSPRIVRNLGMADVTRYVFAGRDIRPADRQATVAMQLDLRGRGFVDKQLARIPLRTSLERRIRVAGVEVVEIDPPGIPAAHYRLTDTRFVAAMGEGVMQQLLAGSAAPGGAVAPAGRTLLSVALSPARLPELATSLRAAAWLAGESGANFAAASAQRLRRYRDGRVRLSLQGRQLVMDLDMRLQ